MNTSSRQTSEQTSDKLRILHITPYYAPAWAYGGVVSAVTGLATAQAAQGYAVSVLTTDALTFERRNRTPRELIDGVMVIRLRNLNHRVRARLNFSSVSPVAFRRTIRTLNPDVIHTHELRTTENLILSVIGAKVPVVLSPHGTLPHGTGRGGFKRAWDMLFGRLNPRMIRHIAALTDSEAQDARALWKQIGGNMPPISVIPNGISQQFIDGVEKTRTHSLDAFRQKHGLGTDPIVLFMGRLHERKGLQYLIPAFEAMLQHVPKARLVIAGSDEGMGARIAELARNIADRVHVVGLLLGENRYAAYAAANVFALPAVGEGLSMACLEAMAAGLPLVVTPGVNLPDVERRGAGLLVEREIAPLADALRALLTDTTRRRAMGANGAAWVRESFTWDPIVRQTESMYRSLLHADHRV
jgi:glycosyltransferase involved in cell wall biosynthesis